MRVAQGGRSLLSSVLSLVVLSTALPACASGSDSGVSDAATIRAAEKYWTRRVSECGDFAFTRERYEVQHPSFSVATSPTALTDADKANGIKWRGVTVLHASLIRKYEMRRQYLTDNQFLRDNPGFINPAYVTSIGDWAGPELEAIPMTEKSGVFYFENSAGFNSPAGVDDVGKLSATRFGNALKGTTIQPTISCIVQKLAVGGKVPDFPAISDNDEPALPP